MACPHSAVGDPGSCSQCHGAVAKVVTRREDGQLLLDGEPALMPDGTPRPFVLGPTEHQAAHYRRGSKASGRVKRKL